MMKMKYRLTAASMALICAAALALPAAANESTEADLPEEASFVGSSDIALRALHVDSLGNRDYPAQPGSTAAILGGKADEIVSFAKKYQFNTLFYEVSPRADALYRSSYLPSSRYAVSEEGSLLLSDPLNVLLETADMERINVVASLSLFYAGESGDTYAEDSPVNQHPDWFITQGTSLYFDPTNPEVREFWLHVVTELVENYELDGILLSGIDCFEDVASIKACQELIDDCMAIVHRQNSSLTAGISLSHKAVEQMLWRDYLSANASSINFILPEMEVSMEAEKNYSDYLQQWTQLLENADIRLYTSNRASLLNYPLVGDTYFGDDMELSYQIYANTVEGADGFVIHSYNDIKGLRSELAEELLLVPDNVSNATRNLKYDAVPSLSLKEDKSIVYTESRQYFLSGRCDPQQPLYINKKEVDRSCITSDGFWGVLWDLDRGVNRVVISQGEASERIYIDSSFEIDYDAGEINDILPDSVYPQMDEVLYEGQPLVLSCTAPYGGSVMAFFQNQTYHLNPPEGYGEEDIGSPVEYSLEIMPEDVDTTQTSNLGTVSYILTYDNFNSKYRSQGEIYLVGNGSRLAVQVTDSVGRVYQNTEQDALVSNLPTGCHDYAAVSSDPNYFRLYNGGYIERKDVAIVEGFVDIQRSIESVGIQSHDRGENLIFVGGAGLPYYASYNEHSNILTFQLSNVVSIPSSLSHLASNIFEDISVQFNEARGTATIRLRLNDRLSLWGYQISYEDGNLYLKCKTPPVISSNPDLPLSGVSIVLDPGHGGVDSGDTTVWGSKGPQEKDITLAYAQSLRRRLENLGAEVSLTRADDSTMDEEDRILYSAFKDADLYLSFQGSSLDSSDSGWLESGLSIYYDSELSHELGRFLYEELSAGLDIETNHFSGNDLSIVKVPLARSLIICPGVLTNPSDYERMTDPVEIYKSSCLLSDLLVDYIRTH